MRNQVPQAGAAQPAGVARANQLFLLDWRAVAAAEPVAGPTPWVWGDATIAAALCTTTTEDLDGLDPQPGDDVVFVCAWRPHRRTLGPGWR